MSHFKKCASADWEMAFAQAAVAAAFGANGDIEGFKRHYVEAEAIGQKLTGPEASHFNAAFRTLSAALANEKVRDVCIAAILRCQMQQV